MLARTRTAGPDRLRMRRGEQTTITAAPSPTGEHMSRVSVACVAAPVLNRAGRAVAALSVAGRLGQIDTRRLSVHARRVAAAASQAAARGLARTA
ncbi:IclR family transcriptional regulator domain-containing protein [Streptomyces sp. NPDC002845]